MNLWLISPAIFLAGFVFLYSTSVILRMAGVSVIVSALVIASAPGDVDNWYMAAALAAIGAFVFLIFRPSWLTARMKVDWQFSLRSLLIATAVLGVCLAFNLWVIQRASEQLSIARSADPILQEYESTIGILEGKVVWLSLNSIPPYDTLGGIEESNRIGVGRWFSGVPDEMYKPFGDSDLANISSDLQQLRYLDLRESIVTEKGLRHLKELNALEQLWLDPSQCTPVGLAHLHDLANLKKISIEPGTMTEDDLAKLRQLLSGCEISLSNQRN